ncbi:orotidine 5-phosphate decarboxylase [Sulfitobacter aestuarii]|uniref:Orotidine 5-phosphate decarboxylase n=1 Tax=Sulfitobacter aestuarii TaxID=2161676 RepID=A0ABW5U4W7_9RHOB
MHTRPVQMTDVTYNAANQCFESLVTLHHGDRPRRYACAIDAPITMSFEDAAAGLHRQALRSAAAETGLQSRIARPAPAQRAGRQLFDPIRWLEKLVELPGNRAA